MTNKNRGNTSGREMISYIGLPGLLLLAISLLVFLGMFNMLRRPLPKADAGKWVIFQSYADRYLDVEMSIGGLFCVNTRNLFSLDIVEGGCLKLSFYRSGSGERVSISISDVIDVKIMVNFELLENKLPDKPIENVAFVFALKNIDRRFLDFVVYSGPQILATSRRGRDLLQGLDALRHWFESVLHRVGEDFRSGELRQLNLKLMELHTTPFINYLFGNRKAFVFFDSSRSGGGFYPLSTGWIKGGLWSTLNSPAYNKPVISINWVDRLSQRESYWSRKIGEYEEEMRSSYSVVLDEYQSVRSESVVSGIRKLLGDPKDLELMQLIEITRLLQSFHSLNAAAECAHLWRTEGVRVTVKFPSSNFVRSPQKVESPTALTGAQGQNELPPENFMSNAKKIGNEEAEIQGSAGANIIADGQGEMHKELNQVAIIQKGFATKLVPCPICSKPVTGTVNKCVHCGGFIEVKRQENLNVHSGQGSREISSVSQTDIKFGSPGAPKAKLILFPCPECSKPVTGAVNKCVHCGSPISVKQGNV